MKWLNQLSTSRISFYIYKLNQNDAIIYDDHLSNKQYIIIIYGLLYLEKIFKNNESMCLAILTKNTLIQLNSKIMRRDQYYYKLVSLNTSYLISFYSSNLSIKNKKHINILININKSYYRTLLKYEKMIHILTHKYIKYRVIQLILLLAQEQGKITNNKITITTQITQSIIGSIVGSNKNTIHKIINYLKQNRIINYSNKKSEITIIDLIALNKFKSIT
uniref:NtcA n=1 Tax=Pterocladia lucida TaxID=31408 RepID=A0A6M3WW83_PTELU|nr:ntcA [Pterocladia lucida]